jgi:hypothetical protein
LYEALVFKLAFFSTSPTIANPSAAAVAINPEEKSAPDDAQATPSD